MASLKASTDRALSCMVCGEELAQPVTLPCLHSCCRGCAASIAVSATSAAATATSPDGADRTNAPQQVIVRCPKCIDAWPEDEAGALHELPAADSTFLSSCLALRKERSQPALCAVCSDEGVKGVAAAVHCLQCHKYLCTPCMAMHSRFLRWHHTVPVDKYRSAPLSLQDGPAPRTCQVHSAAGDLAFYCQSCATTKCVDCLMALCHKLEHEYVPLCAHAGQLRRQLTASLGAVDERFAALTAIRERCRDAVRLLADQKDDALVRLAANKKLLLHWVDACYREIEGRLRTDVNELTEGALRAEEQCRALGDAAALASGYARLLTEQGHYLHLLDQTAAADESLRRLGRPEAVAAVTCPALPSMECRVAAPDPATIKLWLGVPSWTMGSDAIPTAPAAAAAAAGEEPSEESGGSGGGSSSSSSD